MAVPRPGQTVAVVGDPFINEAHEDGFIGSVANVIGAKKAVREIEGLKGRLHKENTGRNPEVDQAPLFEEIVGDGRRVCSTQRPLVGTNPVQSAFVAPPATESHVVWLTFRSSVRHTEARATPLD